MLSIVYVVSSSITPLAQIKLSNDLRCKHRTRCHALWHVRKSTLYAYSNRCSRARNRGRPHLPFRSSFLCACSLSALRGRSRCASGRRAWTFLRPSHAALQCCRCRWRHVGRCRRSSSRWPLLSGRGAGLSYDRGRRNHRAMWLKRCANSSCVMTNH